MGDALRSLGDGWYQMTITAGQSAEVWKFKAGSMREAKEIAKRREAKIKSRSGARVDIRKAWGV